MRRGRSALHAGFTLLELTIVVIIFAVLVTLIGVRTGSFDFLNSQALIRKLSETITFLHYQSLADQHMYQLEIDLGKNEYSVGELIDVGPEDSSVAQMFQDAGTLSLELALMLNPSFTSDQIFSPPDAYPSLADPIPLPEGMYFEDVRTMRGLVTPPRHNDATMADNSTDRPGVAYIRFSPRGFSEFAVIHLKEEDGKETTLLVNPFTGLVDIIKGYKDFQWTYGGNNTGQTNEQADSN